MLETLRRLFKRPTNVLWAGRHSHEGIIARSLSTRKGFSKVSNQHVRGEIERVDKAVAAAEAEEGGPLAASREKVISMDQLRDQIAAPRMGAPQAEPRG